MTHPYDRDDVAGTPDRPEGQSYDALLAAQGNDLDDDVFGSSTAHMEETPARRRTGGSGKGRAWALLAGALVLVVGGAILAMSLLAPLLKGFTESDDYDGTGTGTTTTVKVAPGDTGLVIGKKLADAGVVKSGQVFAEAIAATPGDEIQPGTYKLNKQMSAAEALKALRNEQSRDQTKVTIREGLRATEVFEALSKATKVPVKDYQAAAKNPEKLGLPASVAKGSVEGFLFPATYTFAPGTSAVDQLTELVTEAKTRYAALGVSEKDMHEIVTIASIVEAEARLPQDRPKVAAVIENRLKKPMRLQLDSTVVYGVGKRIITTTDAERADASNPYNTYQHDGLPVGPINNPGEDAVKAAVKPAKGTWLYFVAIDPSTGETLFANTLEEHNRNVLKFQQWCQANPGKC